MESRFKELRGVQSIGRIQGNKWQAFFVKRLIRPSRNRRSLGRSAFRRIFADPYGSYGFIHLDRAASKRTTRVTGFQQAQLEFLRNVVPGQSVPILPNVDSPVLNPTSPAFNPEFFTDVQRIAGGAEAEVFALHSPDNVVLEKEMIEVYLDRAKKTPPGKMMLLNSPTAGLEGNIERTLYVYFTYLLVASPGRAVYWGFRRATRPSRIFGSRVRYRLWAAAWRDADGRGALEARFHKCRRHRKSQSKSGDVRIQRNLL